MESSMSGASRLHRKRILKWMGRDRIISLEIDPQNPLVEAALLCRWPKIAPAIGLRLILHGLEGRCNFAQLEMLSQLPIHLIN
jgi:hypothetical protein